MKKNILPGLDGLRALCAITVVIFHTDQNLEKFSPLIKSKISSIGTQNYAVIMFFVLSGFLITHLLLQENKKFQKIQLSLFYLRRTLRIWPLYFLIIAITAIIDLSCKNYFWQSDRNNFIYYLFFIGNLAYATGKNIIPLTPFWSIAVEEQFYLFWPFLVKAKNATKTLVTFLIIFSVLKAFLRILPQGTLYNLIMNTNFNCMAIGGIGACLAFQKHHLTNWLFRPALQIISWFALLSLYIHPTSLGSIYNSEFYSLFFLIIIMNSAFNEKAIVLLDNRFFIFVGKISYGIYCWHIVIILLICKVFNSQNMSDNWVNRSIIITVVLILTFIVSYLSYKFYEIKFLKLKDRIGYRFEKSRYGRSTIQQMN